MPRASSYLFACGLAIVAFLLGCSSDDSGDESVAGELVQELVGDRIPGLGRVERAVCTETSHEVTCTATTREGRIATCSPATAADQSGIYCGRATETGEEVKANSCPAEQREAEASLPPGELDYSVVCGQRAR